MRAYVAAKEHAERALAAGAEGRARAWAGLHRDEDGGRRGAAASSHPSALAPRTHLRRGVGSLGRGVVDAAAVREGEDVLERSRQGARASWSRHRDRQPVRRAERAARRALTTLEQRRTEPARIEIAPIPIQRQWRWKLSWIRFYRRAAEMLATDGDWRRAAGAGLGRQRARMQS
eukprot:gene28089-61704_t